MARIACECGAFRADLDLTDDATHIRCHCTDCRAALVAFGRPDPGAETGVRVVQTTPDRIRIEAGGEHLALMALSPRGLFRWYAACCGTPVFNTLRVRWMPFAAVLSDRIEPAEALPRVVVESFVKGPDGRPRHVGTLRMLRGLLGRGLRARAAGHGRATPFFDADGAPARPLEILDAARRAAAYAALRR